MKFRIASVSNSRPVRHHAVSTPTVSSAMGPFRHPHFARSPPIFMVTNRPLHVGTQQMKLSPNQVTHKLMNLI